MNRSQKSMLTAAFIFMAIGFATVATTLTINGTVKFTANNDNFGDGVIFTSASSNKGTASISQDGKTIDFETESLSMLNETAVLNYTISNLSTMYDAEATLECVYRDTNNAYNNYIQFSLDKDEYEIASGGSVNGSLTTQLKQVTTDAHQIGIRCTIVANAVERDSVGTLPQSTTTISGVLTDENGNILANTVLAIYSEKQVVVTNEKGFFVLRNLEEGAHNIYVMSNYTEEQVLAMSKSEIESNATASTKFTTTVENKIELTNEDNDKYTIIIKYEDVDVTATNYKKKYDGAYHGITVTSTTPNAIIEYSTDNTAWSSTNPTYKDVGEYTVYYKVSAPGYSTVTGSKVVTIISTIIVARELGSPELVSDYGKNVTGYTPSGSSNWKLLYADSYYVYLISANKFRYYQRVNGVSYSNAITQGGNLTITSTSVAAKMSPLFTNWSSENENVKYAKFLLNPSNFEEYSDMLDENGNQIADWAIGSPTIEMYIASYNAKNNTNITVTANNNGYSLENNIVRNYINENDLYWVLSSPASYDNNIMIWYHSGYGYLTSAIPADYDYTGGSYISPVAVIPRSYYNSTTRNIE